MAITISYDLRTENANHRSYVRSMLERFGWTRLGGSVFRYDGRVVNKRREEDWLNDVVPALMFFRAYTLKYEIDVRFFTLDTNSVARIDLSDPTAPVGTAPQTGKHISLRTPTNTQSSVRRIRRAVDAPMNVLP